MDGPWMVHDVEPMRIIECMLENGTRYCEIFTRTKEIMMTQFEPGVWILRTEVTYRLPGDIHTNHGALCRIFQNRSDVAEDETTQGFLMKKQNNRMYFRINL
jgi:hypothetical protein